MKIIFAFVLMAASVHVFGQAQDYKISWCDRSIDGQSEVKMEMSCLNEIPKLYDASGETLTVKNYRLEFVEDNLSLQCVRSADTKLDSRVFGMLKQSSGFAKARIFDIIVSDAKGKIYRLDQSYYFTITK